MKPSALLACTGGTALRSTPEFPPAEVGYLIGNAVKAQQELGWARKVSFKQLVRMVVDAAFALARQEKTLKDAAMS